MNKENKEPVIIVKKKVISHGAHHGGAWKVAYADFVTAMMALFIVLWIIGQSDKVKSSISEYFEDPVKYEQKIVEGKVKAGIKTPPTETPKPLESSSPTPSPGPSPSPKKPDNIKEELEFLKQEAQKLEKMIASMPEFKRFKNQIKMIVTEEGLRIELAEKSQNEGMFFDLGCAKIKTDAIDLLKVLGDEIGKLPNQVSIEGHTDARPYKLSINYTNWELSADRANAARRILDKNGLRKKQIDEVRGYADQKLRNKNNPLDFSNRRISILIKPRVEK